MEALKISLDSVPRPGIQSRLITSTGTWTSLTDENEFTFIALTTSEYPSRFLSSLLNSFRENFYEVNPTARMGTHNIMRSDSHFLKELGVKYNDPAQWDALSKAQENINIIRLKMQDNLSKIVTTENQMAELAQNTEQMRQNAQEFNKSADELRSNMRWRNCKFCFLAGICTIAAILYIIAPFIFK